MLTYFSNSLQNLRPETLAPYPLHELTAQGLALPTLDLAVDAPDLRIAARLGGAPHSRRDAGAGQHIK